jgi:acetolactate synthase-1/2/3 large subunit
MHITGASKLIDALVKRGVKDIFGYPGGAVLPVLDAMASKKNGPKYYLCRTEQGGGFMADGYSNITGQLGVIMTTSGPGALNTITCLQNALSDGTPILALTGQVSTAVLGSDAFQEADVIGISAPCTKWNKMIKSTNEIESAVNHAIDTAFDNRHGPVLLDLPKNIMSNHLTDEQLQLQPEQQQEKTTNSTVDCEKITQMILESERPVILAGKGVIQAGSEAVYYLRKLSTRYNIPVTTTLLGLGVYDEKSPLSLKMLGMHGSYYANHSIQNCDLLLNFGSRFDDRITGNVSKFAPKAKIVHVDIHKHNINKVIKTPYYINGSCLPILKELTDRSVEDNQRTNKWLHQISIWKRIDFSYPKSTDVLQGREVIAVLNQLMYNKENINKRFTIVADVGAHQMWAAQFIDYNYDRVRFITSGGLGAMGYAVPASIGAAIGANVSTETCAITGVTADAPNHTIICICGDGGFTMSFTELLTAVENRINVKILVINNSYQLMVKMWQDKFYEGRHLGVKMNNPPFEKVCSMLGCESMRIDSIDTLESKLVEFLTYEGGPIVANVITNQSEDVLPMVSPGKALDDMIVFESNSKIQFEGDAPC